MPGATLLQLLLTLAQHPQGTYIVEGVYGDTAYGVPACSTMAAQLRTERQSLGQPAERHWCSELHRAPGRVPEGEAFIYDGED